MASLSQNLIMLINKLAGASRFFLSCIIIGVTFGTTSGVTVAKSETLNSKIYVNGVANGSAVAGVPSKWEFEFIDNETGGTPHHFHVMHQKPMHLVVISEDLSSFAHIHPTERPHSAKSFNIIVNSASADPDNFQLPFVTPKSGRYFIFAEVMPMDYGMLTFPYTLSVLPNSQLPTRLSLRGNTRLSPTRQPSTRLSPTRLSPTDQPFTKWYNENGVEVTDITSASYELRINIEPVEHCGVTVPKINLHLKHRETAQIFQPVQDLETWLGSYGHALVIGRKGSTAIEKSVQHLHAVWPLPTDNPVDDERGPDIELLAHSHGLSTPTDTYRAWVQLKHKGKILTLFFDFNWELTAPSLSLSRNFSLFNPVIELFGLCAPF